MTIIKNPSLCGLLMGCFWSYHWNCLIPETDTNLIRTILVEVTDFCSKVLASANKYSTLALPQWECLPASSLPSSVSPQTSVNHIKSWRWLVIFIWPRTKSVWPFIKPAERRGIHSNKFLNITKLLMTYWKLVENNCFSKSRLQEFHRNYQLVYK